MSSIIAPKERWATQPDKSVHPTLRPKFERDMVPVIEARELIAKIRGEQ
jgi:hypothetical protein